MSACGCRVEIAMRGRARIVYCHLHEAAERLAAALGELEAMAVGEHAAFQRARAILKEIGR